MKLDLAGDPSKMSVLELDGEELEALTHPYPLGSVKYHRAMMALSAITFSVVAVFLIAQLTTGSAPLWSTVPSGVVMGLHFHLARREHGRLRRARIIAATNLPPMPRAVFEGIRMQRRLAEAQIRERRRQSRRRLLPGR